MYELPIVLAVGKVIQRGKSFVAICVDVRLLRLLNLLPILDLGHLEGEYVECATFGQSSHKHVFRLCHASRVRLKFYDLITIFSRELNQKVAIDIHQLELAARKGRSHNGHDRISLAHLADRPYINELECADFLTKDKFDFLIPVAQKWRVVLRKRLIGHLLLVLSVNIKSELVVFQCIITRDLHLLCLDTFAFGIDA